MPGLLTGSITQMVGPDFSTSSIFTASPGNRELLWQIGLNMDLDPASLETREGFQEFLYLSQVYQAVSLKTETETYR